MSASCIVYDIKISRSTLYAYRARARLVAAIMRCSAWLLGMAARNTFSINLDVTVDLDDAALRRFLDNARVTPRGRK